MNMSPYLGFRKAVKFKSFFPITFRCCTRHVVNHGVESGVYFVVESGVTFGVNFEVFFFNSFQKCILFHLQK